jgi:hypothetical protein
VAKKDLNNFQPRLGLSDSFLSKRVSLSLFGVMMPDLGANSIGQNFQEYQGTANIEVPSGDSRHVFRLSQGPPASSYQVHPDVGFGSVNLFSNSGHNTHDAGKVRIEKRYSAGLTLTAWYTRSKMSDESDSDGIESDQSFMDPAIQTSRWQADWSFGASSKKRRHLP